MAAIFLFSGMIMERYIDHFREEHIAILQSKMLFTGMSGDEIRSFIMHARPAYVKLYEGQSMRLDKEYSHMMGLVVTGRTHIYSVSYDGVRTLLRSMEEGESSGMLYSMLDYQNSLVEFVAYEDSEMMMFYPETIFEQHQGDVQVQHKILVNLIQSQKKMFHALTEHLACLSQRTVRDKVLRFLRYYAELTQSHEFTVPFTREELADYLAVDRASLSRTLGELRSEGIVEFNRSHFRVHCTQRYSF